MTTIWKKHKRLFPIATALFALLILSFLWIFNSLNKTSQASLPTPGPNNQSVLMSNEEYDKYQKIFFDAIHNQDPKAAMKLLADDTKSNPQVYRDCHTFAHAIGQESYKKYNDFAQAMQYQDEFCGSGYLHGVMEAYLTSIKSTDIKKQLAEVCFEPGISKGLLGSCYHAIGHGLMYFTANDLPQALGLCKGLGSNTALKRCSEGVYMENFVVDRKAHPSFFLKNDDLFYPCDDPKFPNSAICYFYSPLNYLSSHPEQYQDALSWCNGANATYKKSCAEGAGSRAMKQNIDNPKTVEQICANGPSDLVDSCVAGMASYYIVNFGSFSQAQEMCNTLEDSHKKVCISAVSIRRNAFSKGA